MDLKPGSRWKSAVCDAQLVVVRPPKVAGELQCGGAAVLPIDDAATPTGDVSADFSEGVAIGKRYVAHQGVRRHFAADLGQLFGGQSPHRPVVDEAVAGEFAPEKQVFGYGQRFGKQDFLVYQHDAGILRLVGL